MTDLNREIQDLMMKIHQGKSISPKGFIQVTNAVGWKAQEMISVYQELHLRHTNFFWNLCGEPDFQFSIEKQDESAIYELSFDTKEQAEFVLSALKKFEALSIPGKLKTSQKMFVLNITPILEIEGHYYNYRFHADIWFPVKSIVFENDQVSQLIVRPIMMNCYNFCYFGQSEFFKQLKAKVNETLGLEDFEIEKVKKAEAARIAKIKGSAGHCPICGRLQMLRKVGNKLVMVHHGYQRPGYGEIVGDCFGVHYQPYELSNEGNVAYKPALNRYRESVVARLKNLEDGVVTSLPTGLKLRPTVTVNDKEWIHYFDNAKRNLQSHINQIDKDIMTNDRLINDWSLQPLPKVM